MEIVSPDTERAFGPVHIVPPQSAHTHTVIALHGRGSGGPEFAEELFATRSSDGRALATQFPGCRWVFPSSKQLWSMTFEEDMSSWFEASSLADPTVQQDLQITGIIESSDHIQILLEEEITLLHGKTDGLIFGGISQGGAIALWMMLCRGTASHVGAFFAASTWLPFAENIERALGMPAGGVSDVTGKHDDPTEYDEFIFRNMQTSATDRQTSAGSPKCRVFLGHGVDDAYVDVALGRQARQVLTGAGFDVKWKEYSGAEQEGHWLQEPGEMDDLCHFLQSRVAPP